MNKVFQSYSKYYNLLYKDKDYLSEVNYIEGLIRKYSDIEVKTILDLGCGTGKHDIEFAKKGYKITGIDQSKTMLQMADGESNHKNCRYLSGDAKTINLNEEFDAIISLFHVASYQVLNEDLYNYFKVASNHLKKGGNFLFDFWYGPAVLHFKPQIKERLIEEERIKIKRITTPILKPNFDKVEVKFENIIEDKISGETQKIKETHNMRYLFLPELDFLLKLSGFEIIASFEWMTEKKMTLYSWNGIVVAKLA